MMTNTYTWIVEYMSCYPEAEGETDVVFVVGWRCNATDGTFNATQYGTVNVTYVAGDPYTPYADLTEVQVQDWVWANGVDQAATEASLATNIANQVNPPVVNPPLPWSA
jgi:hypothetical protein